MDLINYLFDSKNWHISEILALIAILLTIFGFTIEFIRRARKNIAVDSGEKIFFESLAVNQNNFILELQKTFVQQKSDSETYIGTIKEKLSNHKNLVERISEKNISLLLGQEYTRAIQEFRVNDALQIISKNSVPDEKNVAEINYQKGMLYDFKFDYVRSIHHFEIAVKLEPSVSLYLQGLANAYMKMGKYDDSLNFFNKALKVSNGNIELESDLINSIGEVYELKGNYNEAINWYEKSIQHGLHIVPKNESKMATRYNNLGLSYNLLGNFEEAILNFKKAIELVLQDIGDIDFKYNLTSLYGNMGLALNYKGDYKEALNYCNNAMKSIKEISTGENPFTALIHNNFGLVYTNLENFKEAKENFEKALLINQNLFGEIHPATALAYLNLSLPYFKLDNFEKTEFYLDTALKIFKEVHKTKHPDIATCYYNLGVLRDKQGRFKESLQYFENALENYKASFDEDNEKIIATRKFIDLVSKKI